MQAPQQPQQQQTPQQQQQQPVQQLPPIAERTAYQQQQAPSTSATVAADGASSSIQAPRTHRPSRLSAVLVPAVPGGAGPHSPPLSPPSSPAGGAAERSPGSEAAVSKPEKQEYVLVSPKPSAGAPAALAKPSSPAAAAGGKAGLQPAPSLAAAGKAAVAGPPGVLTAASTRAGPGLASTAGAAAAAGGSSKGPAPTAAPSPKASTSSSVSDSSEGNDEGSEWGWDTGSTPWYLQPRKLAVLVLLLASAVAVLAGLVLQVVLRDPHGLDNDYEQVFPWLYFFAAFPPLALALRWLCWRLYTALECTAIREELYFLRPLRTKLAGLLFWMTVLLWFQTCFHWVWCRGVCGEEAYTKALVIIWRLLVCITLWSAANFLKCSLARLLSYSFYRTAHFEKVRDAIERELYLIRLSQARSTLLPPPPPPADTACDTGDQQQDGEAHLRRPGVWGSTVWLHKTSQAFLGHHQHHFGAAQQHEAAAEGPSTDQAEAGMGGGPPEPEAADKSAFARPTAQHLQQQHQQQPHAQGCGMRHVASADRIVEDAAVHVQVRQLSDAVLRRPLPCASPGATAAAAANAGTTPPAAAASDKVPLLQQPASCPASAQPKLSCWLQPDMMKPQQQHPAAAANRSDQPGRQQSYELFAAERVPSILGMQQRSSRTGSRAGSRAGQQMLRGRTGSRFSRVSLPGMVAGVDGLLLQPEVLGSAGAVDGQAQRSGKPMTEEELAQLRARLGVNTFGTFVDRYYGLSAKEEAAHVRQVKRFAEGLFANVLGDADRDHLLPEDFLLFFDSSDEDAAHDAFAYFDRNGDGSISCTELQDSAAEMLCERKNIAASIKDTDSVVNSLETGLGMLIHFLAFAVYLLVCGVNIVQGFTTFSATALALTFVFGDSVKGVFESAIYLFVTHPYDVGDALWFSPGPGQSGQLARVKKIDLQFTVLLRRDGQLVWHPNSSLRAQPLVNLSRSSNRWESYTWLVDIDTPDEVLTQLQDALAAHVSGTTQRAHFACNPAVTWRALEDPLKLRLAVGVTYSFTGEDAGRYVAARHGILAVVRRELQRMGVTYTVPVQQQKFAPVVQAPTTPLQ